MPNFCCRFFGPALTKYKYKITIPMKRYKMTIYLFFFLFE